MSRTFKNLLPLVAAMARGAAICCDRLAEVDLFCDRFADMGAVAAALGAEAEVCKCQKCQKRP